MFLKKLQRDLGTFQTSVLMVLFLVACLQSLFRGFAERFILPDVLKKVSPTYKLSQLDKMDESIQKRTYEVSFSIVHDLCVLKNEGKMTDFKTNTFKNEARRVISTLCNHYYIFLYLLSTFLILPEKVLYNLLQKLVDGKLFFKNWLMAS